MSPSPPSTFPRHPRRRVPVTPVDVSQSPPSTCPHHRRRRAPLTAGRRLLRIGDDMYPRTVAPIPPSKCTRYPYQRVPAPLPISTCPRAVTPINAPRAPPPRQRVPHQRVSVPLPLSMRPVAPPPPTSTRLGTVTSINVSRCAPSTCPRTVTPINVSPSQLSTCPRHPRRRAPLTAGRRLLRIGDDDAAVVAFEWRLRDAREDFLVPEMSAARHLLSPVHALPDSLAYPEQVAVVMRQPDLALRVVATGAVVCDANNVLQAELPLTCIYDNPKRGI